MTSQPASGVQSAAASSPLESMIAPLTPDQFFAQYYERDYYRTPQPVAAVSDLLSIDRIDEIISDSELPPTSLSMAKSGDGVPVEDYTFPNGVIDRGSVLDNYRNGATIVLPQLQFADGKLYNFCLALEKEFGARVQTNIYLTPNNASGFGIHYDDHDVFVLQVSGSKKWEIYGQREELPFRGENFRKDHDEVGELKDSFVLHPGECLYVPRGLAHRAANEGDQASLHITVGILVQTWAEFMLEAVAEASLRIPEMRTSLPRSLYFNDAARAGNEAQFLAFFDQLRAQASFDATLSAFGSNFIMDQGTRVRGALNTLCRGIAENDRFRVRQSILYSLETKGEEPQLALAGSAVALKPDVAEQLAQRLAIGDLAMSDFAVEDSEDLRDTVETLVAFGLLEPVN